MLELRLIMHEKYRQQTLEASQILNKVGNKTHSHKSYVIKKGIFWLWKKSMILIYTYINYIIYISCIYILYQFVYMYVCVTLGLEFTAKKCAFQSMTKNEVSRVIKAEQTEVVVYYGSEREREVCICICMKCIDEFIGRKKMKRES